MIDILVQYKKRAIQEKNIEVFFSFVIYVFWGAEPEFQLCHHEKVVRSEKIAKNRKKNALFSFFLP